MRVQSTRPDPRLGPFIRWYVHRESQVSEPELIEPVVARTGAMLEFQFADPYDVPAYGVDQPNPSVPITVIGPIPSRRVRLIVRGHVEALAVLFRPLGFFRLFGVPVYPLSGMGTEGHAVLGPCISTLFEQLGNSPVFADRAALLDRFFVRMLGLRCPIPEYGKALRLLHSSPGGSSVARLANEAGMSTRQLQRRSLEITGLSPRKLAKIARFQHALHTKFTHESTWIDVAYASGYYDQMHLIHDFLDLAGAAPNQLLLELAPDHLISHVCR